MRAAGISFNPLAKSARPWSVMHACVTDCFIIGKMLIVAE
jgi:hypothetical protein